MAAKQRVAAEDMQSRRMARCIRLRLISMVLRKTRSSQ